MKRNPKNKNREGLIIFFNLKSFNYTAENGVVQDNQCYLRQRSSLFFDFDQTDLYELYCY